MSESKQTSELSRTEKEAGLQRAASDAMRRQSYQVMDLGFAVALFSVGVPLHSTPSRVVEYADGVRRPVYNFQRSDPEGFIDLEKCSWAANDPLRYIAENPMNPLSFALATIMNYPKMARDVATARAVVPMRASGGGAVVMMTKDSRLHRAALQRGMVPCPAPDKPESKLEIPCKLEL